MITLTLNGLDIVLSILVVLIVGAAGTLIGAQLGFDRGEADAQMECARHHTPPPSRRPPPGTDIYGNTCQPARLPVRPPPPDTIPDWYRITTPAPQPQPHIPIAAAILYQPPPVQITADGEPPGRSSPAADELAIRQKGEQLELEIKEMCDEAERRIGGIINGRDIQA